MSSSAVLTDRTVLAVSGADAANFLQGLITNDIRKLAPDAALYAALLTPQGKILFDLLLYDSETSILLDCAGSVASAFRQRLMLYRLRAKVEILERDDLAILASWDIEDLPASWRDPRLDALGFRAVVRKSALPTDVAPLSAYSAHRLELGVPEGQDFGENAMFALDAGLEELHGVAFDKGCYVGQELTARMKHRGTARKRLLPVDTVGKRLPAVGSAIMSGDREIGILTAVYDTSGFALLRLDRLEEAAETPLSSEGIPVRVVRPAWLFS